LLTAERGPEFCQKTASQTETTPLPREVSFGADPSRPTRRLRHRAATTALADGETDMKRTVSILATSLLAATAALAAAASASAADFPAGTYTASGLTLFFDGNGHCRASQKDAVKVEGDCTVEADKLHFTDRSGPWACPAEQTGTYRWMFKTGKLTLTKISDKCKDRVGSLTGHSWARQG
jgi:hypothetical protein